MLGFLAIGLFKHDYTHPRFFFSVAAILVIVFAYGGAELMVEMLSEMENPADFTKSINFSFLILIFFYYVGKKRSNVSCSFVFLYLIYIYIYTYLSLAKKKKEKRERVVGDGQESRESPL